ncbi:hypothetical protein LJB99_01320 [Deltaproteobacteria bacterium OttesenSCG-928-K17]|nr:hypothetical protein [Deltaproteobacteria bacterium OttesenSCG-928-K17]
MSKISMFAAYSQKENIVTNNTMLLLKTIYNDSVFVFDRLVARLVGLDSIGFGIRFEQQSPFKTPDGTKISDGLIEQEPISIYVETKTTDWFYSVQIERYKNFMASSKPGAGRKILILLSNFETKERLQKDVLNQLSSDPDDEVLIAAVGFDELLHSVKEEVKTDNDVIRTMIADFETYLTDEGLLPTWTNTMEIIPMGGSLEKNKKFVCYSCPNSGKRGYSHARSKYLGFYNQKKIDEIAEIDAVIDLKSRERESWELKWNNSEQDEEALKDRAEAIIADSEYYANSDFEQGGGVLIFLLSNMQTSVNFQKISPGGIMGRQYMKFKDIKAMDDLLSKIKDETWRSNKDWS